MRDDSGQDEIPSATIRARPPTARRHAIAAPFQGCPVAVIGASGAIGGALATALATQGAQVHRFARRPASGSHPIELTDEATIAAAAASCPPGLRLVLVATGALHAPGMAVEKSWRQLDGPAMLAAYAINTVGPALVAKHFLPLLPRTDPSVFAVLAARVGSIADNRAGGWYSYRASKAALAMVIRTLSIELARTRPDAACIGLHPGTVASNLSHPFATNAPSLFTPATAATHLLAVLATVTPSETGQVLAWDGTVVPP